MRKLVFLSFSLFLLFVGPIQAQTTPTAFETQVGVSCKKAAHGTDFDTLVQCTSTDATAGTLQKAPLFVGAVTAPPYTATTCDANKKGMIQYDGTDMQFCNGTTWEILPTKSYVDAAGGGTTRHSQVFTSSGTWTKPDGVTVVDVMMMGAGGGGGGAYGYSTTYRAGGGGGGAGNLMYQKDVVVSSDLTITIGAGGTGAPMTANGIRGDNGQDGGASSVTGTDVSLTVSGGKGGYAPVSYSTGGANTSGEGGGSYLSADNEFPGRNCESVSIADLYSFIVGAGGGGAGVNRTSTGSSKGSKGGTCMMNAGGSYGDYDFAGSPGGGGASFFGAGGVGAGYTIDGGDGGVGAGGGGGSTTKVSGNGGRGLVVIYWWG